MTYSFDAKRFLFKVLAHWYLFLISMPIAYAFAYYKAKTAVTTYSANTTLMIKSQYNPDNAVGGLQLFSNSKNIQGEIAIFKSFQFNLDAIRELDFKVSYVQEDRFVDKELYKQSPFIVHSDSTNYNQCYQKVRIKILSARNYQLEIGEENKFIKQLQFGETFKNQQFTFSIELRNPTSYNSDWTKNVYFFFFNDTESLVNEYANNLNISDYSPGSMILWLWIIGQVPEKQVDYLNKLTEIYIRRELTEKNQIAQNTIRFIDERLRNIIDSLQITENTLQEFRSNNQIVDISTEGKDMYERLKEVESRKITAELKYKYYDFLQRDLKQRESFSNLLIPTTMGVEDANLSSLVNKLSELSQKQEVLSLSINEKGFGGKRTGIPEYDELTIGIEKTKNTIFSLIGSNLDAARTNLRNLEKENQELSYEIQKLPITERKMLQITRKFEMNDNIYTYLLQKRMEAGITQASNKADSRILDSSRLSQVRVASSGGGESRNKILFIGFIIPVILVFLRDYLNNKIVSRNDIEDFTDIPILGAIAHNTKNSVLPVIDFPKSPLAEGFRSLRTSLQYLLNQKKTHLIVISSSVGGEGKTFFTGNLGAILASSQKRVLLVGLDLRKPKIHTLFKMTNEIGMSTHLIGKNTFEEVVFPTHYPNLFVSPAGPVPPNPAELIETQAMKNFMEHAKQQFDYVIIDTPPIALVTDALLIANYADTNIFIIRQNYTQKNVVKMFDELYKERLTNNMCLVLNDTQVSGTYNYVNHSSYGYYSSNSGGYYEEEDEPKTIIQRIRHFFKTK